MKNFSVPTRERGLSIARRMKERLRAEGIPVVQVYLFGSLARSGGHQWSDVDVAIVHEPFARNRSQERRHIRAAREEFDVPLDIICLHPGDLDNRLLGIAQEIRRTGIVV